MLKNIIAFANSKSAAAEAYRTLRTNIQFSSLDNDLKTIVITSSTPGEGKTTVLSNIALTIAQSGKKVLILDCDLRKPTIHKLFGLLKGDGLTSILAENKKIEECIFHTESENLYVIPSGPVPPNPSELLGSKKMRLLLKELETAFDFIIIDSPPVLAVTDAQVLSTFVDGVLLVAAFGQTDKNAVVKSKDLLTKVEAKILGVVINKIPRKAESYYNYYGKYGYTYHAD